MGRYVSITEDWIKEKVKISNENLEDIKTLILQGNYEEKISSVGTALIHFSRLKILDLSRNVLKTIKGIEHIRSLEVLNLYYNCIEDLAELRVLSNNQNLKDLDLRLNPVSRLNSDYRLYLTHLLPNLKTLDCRSVRDAEKRAAISYFGSQSNQNDPGSHFITHKTEDNRIQKSKSTRDLNLENLNTMYKYSLDNHYLSQNLESRIDDEHLKSDRNADDELETYEFNTKLHDPWTNYFLRLNSKALSNYSTIDPPRSMKHAEFYNSKERLKTEIEFGVNGKCDKTKEKERNGDNCDNLSRKTLNEQNSNMQYNEFNLGNSPRIPPRAKRYTPSSSNEINKTKKSINLEEQKEEPVDKIQEKEQISNSKGNAKSQNGFGIQDDLEKKINFNNLSADKIDHAFFLVMKNFIEEAVSESFARYKFNEISSNCYPKLSNKTIFSSPDKSKSDPYYKLNLDNTINFNGENEDKNKYEVEKLNSDELRKKELEIENSRLIAEVERLKSRLNVYEEVDLQP